MKLRTFLLACMICALCAVQASALEYSYDGADDFLFARPTSDDTIYETENPNVDRSKNVALVAPGFGSPTSYLPGSGEHLTPNLVPGALSGGLVNQVGGANYSVSENGVSGGMGGFLPSTSILDGGSSNGSKVTFTMSDAPTAAWDVDSAVTISGLDNDAADGNQPGNQAHGVEVRTLTEPVDSSAGRRYAQAKLDLSTLMSKVKDGSTLTIGDTTYTFAVGKESSFKGGSNVIDLSDMTEDDLKAQEASTLGKVASRITTAAQGNKNFKVTSTSAVGDTNPDGYIYFTEKEGGVDTDNYKLEGTNNKTSSSTDGDWTGFIKLGTVDTASMGKALTLQIGDTSDSYNQLKVNVGDMHTKALGIAGLDISSPEAASNAIQTIRDAINQVSSVRGDLGATQNRLEHTANNLSVMAENIQDAESTIRDTDVAEEMMSYTKNNILVQSAQAMLAQANAVPQGVLQLLG